MPLEDPATMCHQSERHRTRVECLHHTLKLFRRNKDKYLRRATRNLVRWSHNQQSRVVMTRFWSAWRRILWLLSRHSHASMEPFLRVWTWPIQRILVAHTHLVILHKRRTYFDELMLIYLWRMLFFTRREGVVVYTDEMQQLINADKGHVYFSKVPLICIKGKEDVSMPNLGYELLKKRRTSFHSTSYGRLLVLSIQIRWMKINFWNCHKIKEIYYDSRRNYAQFRTLIDSNVRGSACSIERFWMWGLSKTMRPWLLTFTKMRLAYTKTISVSLPLRYTILDAE